MTTSLFAAQEAVYTVLAANTDLHTLIGNPVRLYDYVPPAPSFPYVTLGDVGVRDYSTKDQSGFDQTLYLNVWSRYRGRKELKVIMQTLYDVLHESALTVASAQFVDCRFISASTQADADGLTYRGSMRFRIFVQH